MILAANKIDLASEENIGHLVKAGAIPVSGATEVVLRLADKGGAIKYIPGDADFVESPKLSDAQKDALSKIRTLMKKMAAPASRNASMKRFLSFLTSLWSIR